MKPSFSRQLALLFLLYAATHSTVLHPRRLSAVPPVPSAHPPTRPGDRRLADQLSVAAVSVPNQQVQVKTRVFSSDELVQRVESYGHQAWETANELKALIETASKGQGKSGSAALTPEEEVKVKQAISFVREANTCLKYYIDHFILTEEVLQKYEEYISKHPQEASSTNGVLKFMVHEFREIHLRKFEKAFFEKVKMYNSVIKDKFTPLFFLPVVDKNVHALQIKLLNGQRLIIFIKKYMAFVTRLQRGFHLLDYEKGNSLFREPDHDPSVGRLKVVSNKEYARIQKANARRRQHSTVTIVVGNEEYGSKLPAPAKLPSDYIENKEEIQLNAKQAAGAVSGIVTQVPVDEEAQTQVPEQGSELQGTVVAMSVPSKKQAQEPMSLGGLEESTPRKFINPLAAEKEAFIQQKMAEMERMFGHHGTPALRQNDQTMVANSVGGSNSEAAQANDRTVVPQSFAGSGLAQNKPQLSQAKPALSQSLNGKLIHTTGQNLVELDKDGLPVNLNIQRVPEVIRMDERYQDPFVVGGKAQTGLTSKVEELEGKRVGANFGAQAAQQKLEEAIPARRVIYHPNEVNGGLPQQTKTGIADPDLSQLDEIIKDNGVVDKAKLRQVDSLLGIRKERALWDEDLGAVYSRLMGPRLI